MVRGEMILCVSLLSNDASSRGTPFTIAKNVNYSLYAAFKLHAITKSRDIGTRHSRGSPFFAQNTMVKDETTTVWHNAIHDGAIERKIMVDFYQAMSLGSIYVSDWHLGTQENTRCQDELVASSTHCSSFTSSFFTSKLS